MAILEPKYETMPRKELEQLQLERLQSMLHRCYKNIPFFRNRLEDAGVDPHEVRRIEDIARIPFTKVEEVNKHYPYDLFATPLREVVRLHAGSGLTGLPRVSGYTTNDVANWSRLTARALAAAGVTNDDVLQIAFGRGVLTSAFGFHHGAERLGASVIPLSRGDAGRQIRIMRDFHTTVVACTPSYALMLADKLKRLDINPNTLSLRIGLFFGETWSDDFRDRIETELKITATDHYGVSELMSPGIAYECSEQDGLHIAEDHFLAEIVDPATDEALPPGAVGELALTSLTKEATPIIRFRTHDITCIDPEPCACGRTLLRMAKLKGRTDDMIKIMGVEVFPARIGEIIAQTLGQPIRHKALADQSRGAAHLKVAVEITESFFMDTMKGMERELRGIEAAIESELGIAVRIQVLERHSFERLSAPGSQGDD